MKNLLKELQKTKIVKITGSYADGSQNEFSDIDFYVKDENIDTPREKRNIVKIIKILDNYNIR